MKTKLLKETSVSNLLEFQQVVRDFQKIFSGKSVIALDGPMGCGKTEFVKTVCQNLGISQAASPTFAIHHHYHKAQIAIEHLDLYRLQGEEELESTGFWDLFSGPDALIFIEWAKNMNLEQIPQTWDLYLLEISIGKESGRNLKLFKRL